MNKSDLTIGPEYKIKLKLSKNIHEFGLDKENNNNHFSIGVEEDRDVIDHLFNPTEKTKKITIHFK